MPALSPVSDSSSASSSSSALDAFKISVKFFAQPTTVGAKDYVPLFHRWIQEHLLSEHLLIDVANYDHVVDGPGTVLIAHEANISMDREDGRLGLLYFRKQPLAGDFAHRLKHVLRYTLQACQLLEQSLPGRLHFRTNELLLRVHDRLLAPATPQTFAAIAPIVQSTLDHACEMRAQIKSLADAEQLFGLQAHTTDVKIETLLQRLA